jgi:hypothetical protein
MIKIVKLEIAGMHKLRLSFSDGRSGVWNGYPLLASKPTVLTMPLLQPAEFDRAFIEAGALAWPNGLEFAPWTLYSEMDESGLLTKAAA